jgi:hypothetical protein
LGNRENELILRLAGERCLEMSVSVGDHRGVSSVVSLRDPNETVVLTEELMIRARDAAFERAMRALVNRELLVDRLPPGVPGGRTS